VRAAPYRAIENPWSSNILISVEEALAEILNHVRPLEPERVPILEALGRVLPRRSSRISTSRLLTIRPWTAMRSARPT